MALYECISGSSGLIDIEKNGDLLWETSSGTSSGAFTATLDAPEGLYTTQIQNDEIFSGLKKAADLYPYYAIITINGYIITPMDNLSEVAIGTKISTTRYTRFLTMQSDWGTSDSYLFDPDSRASWLTDSDVVSFTKANFFNYLIPQHWLLVTEKATGYTSCIDLVNIPGKTYYDVQQGDPTALTASNCLDTIVPDFSLLSVNDYIVKKISSNSYQPISTGEVTSLNYTNYYLIKPESLISKFNMHYMNYCDITTAYRVNASGSSTNYLKPYKIYGLKGKTFNYNP